MTEQKNLHNLEKIKIHDINTVHLHVTKIETYIHILLSLPANLQNI